MLKKKLIELKKLLKQKKHLNAKISLAESTGDLEEKLEVLEDDIFSLNREIEDLTGDTVENDYYGFTMYGKNEEYL